MFILQQLCHGNPKAAEDFAKQVRGCIRAHAMRAAVA